MISSTLTALTTIFNSIKGVGKGSKTTVDTYIQNQMKPFIADIKQDLKGIKKDIVNMKVDIDNDEMQNLRYNCLCFASDVRKGIAKTRQEYEEVFRMETRYNTLIAKYKVQNGYMHEEMLYVHNQYRALSNTQK